MNQTEGVKPLLVRSKTQTLTGIGLFAALAVMLNFLLKVPAPYAPFLYYEVWEIPIIAVLLLFGAYAALSVSIINTAVLLLVFPGALPTGPLYNLAAVLVTLGAVIVGHSFGLKLKLSTRNLVIIATGLGIVVRSIVMTTFNFLLLPLSPPVGFSYPLSAVIPILPLIAFFNATVALYSIPFGYTVVRAVTSRFRFKIAYPFQQPQPKPS
jgi:riboflavin transporter FmnP